MLPYIGSHDGIGRFSLRQLAEQQRRVDSVAGMIVAPGVFPAQIGCVLPPGVDLQRLLQRG